MSNARLSVFLLALVIVFSGITPVWLTGSAVNHPLIVDTAENIVDANDGVTSLREAINRAGPGDTITFAPGLGPLTPGVLFIRDPITIRGNGPEDTIIDGEDSTVLLQVQTPGVVIEDLTIQNGTAGDGSGAGLHVRVDGEVTIRNATLRGNTATSGPAVWNAGILVIDNVTLTDNEAKTEYEAETAGGAITNSGTLTIKNTALEFNMASGDGGAIDNSGTLSIDNTTFDQNSASGGDGGAIHNQAGAFASVADSTFTDNSASGDGGAIRNHGELRVLRTAFADHIASNGGAVSSDNADASLIISHATFRLNRAVERGGAVYSGAGQVATIENSTFVANDAFTGGAVALTDRITIFQSTFAGNLALVSGGAIYFDTAGGPSLIAHSTIVGNTALHPGSGAGVHNNGRDNINVTGTILAGNTADDDAANCQGAILLGSANIESDDTCGFDDANGNLTMTDPMLSVLADNGGHTLTLAPAADSPAVDMLDAAACPFADQRGVDRPQDDGCDIGAVEYVEALTIAAPDPSGFVPGADPGIATLRGTNLADDAVLTAGEGVTIDIIGSPEEGALHILVTVAPDAALGARDVTITRDGIGTFDCLDCLHIIGAFPEANFSFASDIAFLDQPMGFIDESVAAGDPDSWAWDWSFGDGATSTESMPLHTFATLGTFEVTLEVTDAFGNKDIITKPVDVVLRPLGGGDDAVVIPGTVAVVEGTVPATLPTVEAFADDLLQLNLRAGNSGDLQDYELEGLGVDETTVFNISLENVDYVPRLLLGSGKVLSWDVTENLDGTYDVNVTVRPVAQQMILDCKVFGEENGCVPGEKWPKGRKDRANESASYNLTVQLAIDSLEQEFDGEPFFSAAEREVLNGTILTTDAQEFGQPEYMLDEGGNATLSLYVAGPHRTWDNKPHNGFYEAFLPQALLDAWGVTDLTMLSAAYGGDRTAFTVQQEEGGARMHLPIHYSSGTVTLTAEELPAALIAAFTNEAKARMGEAITLRDTTRGGTQPYVWNWTLPNGTTSDEQNFTFTPDEVGPLKVTLEVTDADGNTSKAERTIQVFNTRLERAPVAKGAAANFGVGAKGSIKFEASDAGVADVAVRFGNSPTIFEEVDGPIAPPTGRTGLRYLEVEPGGDHTEDSFGRVVITLDYSDEDLAAAGLTASQLEILYWNGTTWTSTFSDTDAEGNITGTPRTKDLHVFETGREDGTIWAIVNHTSQYALAGSAPAPTGGGGGGGSGSPQPSPSPSPSPSVTPVPMPSATPTPSTPALSSLTQKRLEAVVPGTPAAALIGDGNVHEVRLTTSEALSGVTVSVRDLASDRPADATVDAPGRVLRYLDITVETDAGALASGTVGGTVTFLATADALAAADLVPGRVALAHWDGNAWEILATTYLGEADGRHWFEATTGGFSPFAIVGTEDNAEVATGANAQENPASPLLIVGLVAIAVLAAAGAGGYGWWHQAGRPRDLDAVRSKAGADLTRLRDGAAVRVARIKDAVQARLGGRKD